ncbi:hypothetical protein NHJ13051_009587 [Beauveria bassiana]
MAKSDQKSSSLPRGLTVLSHCIDQHSSAIQYSSPPEYRRHGSAKLMVTYMRLSPPSL